MKVTVIGLGAMGGGMARSLLKCPAVDEIAGFDLSKIVVTTFFNDAKGKYIVYIAYNLVVAASHQHTKLYP